MSIRLPFMAFFLLVSACKSGPASVPFADDFERERPGAVWFDTIGRYVIDRGVLTISGGYNHPLWLRRSLPREVEISLRARALSPDGDLKIELFGDGRSFAFNRGRYLATGYVLCQGGWNNSKTFIARRDEHDPRLLATSRFPVEIGKWHEWRIATHFEGSRLVISWWIDGVPALRLVDPEPLYGPDNRHFGFSNWKSDANFDDLRIEPLTQERRRRLEAAWNAAMPGPPEGEPAGSLPGASGPAEREPPMPPDPSGGIPE